MEKQQNSPSEKEAKSKLPADLPSQRKKEETEFADELTSSDIKQAFQNPVTGEERLY